MRNGFLKIKLLTVVCLMAGFCPAQTPIDDFGRVRQAYASLTGLSVNMEYTVFRGHEGTQATTVQSGSFRTDMKNRYLFKVGDVTRLHNERYDIMVSGEEKVIVVETAPQAKVVPLFGVDTTGGLWKKAVKIGEGNGIRTWRINYEGYTEFEKMDVTVDTKTFLIKNISLYYRLKMGEYLNSEDAEDDYCPKLGIRYSQAVLNPVFSAEEFSEKKYIQVTEKGILPAEAYKNYELIIRNP